MVGPGTVQDRRPDKCPNGLNDVGHGFGVGVEEEDVPPVIASELLEEDSEPCRSDIASPPSVAKSRQDSTTRRRLPF